MATTINADTSTGGAVVTGDASGVLGLQAAGSTQVTISTSGVVLANPLPVASGGTGGSATPTAGGVVYGTGTVQAVTAAGTAGQVLQSNGASAPSWSAIPVTTKTWTAVTSTGSYTVPTGITSVRVYAFGGGGNGAAGTSNTGYGGGGGGGCAFGDLAVTAGQVYTVTISAGVATVTRSGTTYFTANKGAAGTTSAGGAGGTASKDASVTNGGAYTGGAGGWNSGGSGYGGGSSGSPLGTGYAGSSGTQEPNGGGGWGGVGSENGGGGGVGGAGSYGGGGAGGAAVLNTNTDYSGGPSRTQFNAFSDPLLASLDSPGTAFVLNSTGSAYQISDSAGPGGGTGGAYNSTFASAGTAGMGGGGGGAYCDTGGSKAFGGGSVFGGGGGASRTTTGVGVGGSSAYAGGGGGCRAPGGATAGTGGAAIVLFYA